MPVSDERVKEVIEYGALNGVKAAMDAFSLPEETYNRYARKYRQVFGEVNDTIGRLRDKYSDDELEQLLEMDLNRPRRPMGTMRFDGEDFCFLIMSDTHVGSTFFEESILMSAFEEGHRQGCTAILHGGDLLEGMSGRPGQIYELTHIGYSAQKKYAVDLFKRWGKDMYFIVGNHDLWVNSKAGTGIDVGEDIESSIPGSHYLGVHEGAIMVNGAKFMLWHGEDGSSYSTSYRPQKIVEAFNGGEKPSFLSCAHTHKSIYLFERNIHVISSGSIQKQSGFMRYKRLPAHVGFWIVRGKINNGEITQISPTWYPIYK